MLTDNMEIFIKNGKLVITKTKKSDITLFFTEKDINSMNSYKSIRLLEQKYNDLNKIEDKKDLSQFNFNKINCDEEKNKNVCKNKMTILPQIIFNNKYNQEFKIVRDIPRKRIYKFIKKRSKYMKNNDEYPLLAILYIDTTSSISNKFMDIWRYITDNLENNEDIKLIVINCTQNPKVCIRFDSVPHIKFKLQYKKKNLDYNGNLILNDIMVFIHKLLYDFKNNEK